tara:strand:- start:1089 stop:1565 length:477 start_codon:yes stop_codon:yes gene_type:complete
MTQAQRALLRTGILADTDPAIVAAVAAGANNQLLPLINAASTTDAWLGAATRQQLFEAIDLTQFDGITAGKRDAWKLLMDNAPIDFGRVKMRKAVSDSWSSLTQGQRDTILGNLVEKATKAEVYIGGTNRTEGGVTALGRNVVGAVSSDELSKAMLQQ